ncbi:MAG: hypothetical protein ACOYJB_03665, partial [Christensenellaceae bacterium]|jgi:hypothetical protein
MFIRAMTLCWGFNPSVLILGSIFYFLNPPFVPLQECSSTAINLLVRRISSTTVATDLTFSPLGWERGRLDVIIITPIIVDERLVDEFKKDTDENTDKSIGDREEELRNKIMQYMKKEVEANDDEEDKSCADQAYDDCTVPSKKMRDEFNNERLEYLKNDEMRTVEFKPSAWISHIINTIDDASGITDIDRKHLKKDFVQPLERAKDAFGDDFYAWPDEVWNTKLKDLDDVVEKYTNKNEKSGGCTVLTLREETNAEAPDTILRTDEEVEEVMEAIINTPAVMQDGKEIVVRYLHGVGDTSYLIWDREDLMQLDEGDNTVIITFEENYKQMFSINRDERLALLDASEANPADAQSIAKFEQTVNDYATRVNLAISTATLSESAPKATGKIPPMLIVILCVIAAAVVGGVVLRIRKRKTPAA